MPWKIKLVRERPKHMMETKPRWRVHLNGEPWGDAFYFNMTGYRGLLPTPEGSKLDPGEIGIKALRQEVSRLNREAKAAGGAA